MKKTTVTFKVVIRTSADNGYLCCLGKFPNEDSADAAVRKYFSENPEDADICEAQFVKLTWEE